jgi:hypothetical protein
VIGLGGAARAAAFRDEMGITFPLLVDEKRLAYRAAGLRAGSLFELFRPFHVAARRRAAKAGYRQTGLGRNPFQLGGTFVFGPGDRDWLRHVAATYGDVVDPSALENALRGRPTP